jgi:DNA-binding NarL/FixJ family response regulator
MRHSPGVAKYMSMPVVPEAAKRILLVDDHPAVSQRISELLAGAVPHAEMVAASSGEQGLALIAEQTFDLVLLDLRLPGCGGIEVLKELRASKPGLPVIIISSLPESPYATLARRAGAHGFVTKSALVQELGQAVRTVLGDCSLA